MNSHIMAENELLSSEQSWDKVFEVAKHTGNMIADGIPGIESIPLLDVSEILAANNEPETIYLTRTKQGENEPHYLLASELGVVPSHYIQFKASKTNRALIQERDPFIPYFITNEQAEELDLLLEQISSIDKTNINFAGHQWSFGDYHFVNKNGILLGVDVLDLYMGEGEKMNFIGKNNPSLSLSLTIDSGYQFTREKILEGNHHVMYSHRTKRIRKICVSDLYEAGLIPVV